MLSRRGDKRGVLNVPIRRPHCVGSDAENVSDDFFGPAQLGNDLFVRQGSERRVTPGVNADLMATHVLGLQHDGEGYGTGDGGWSTRADDNGRTIVPRSYHIEGRLEPLRIKVAQQFRRMEGRAIIVRQTPGVLVRAGGDVIRAGATSTSPPTTIGIVGKSLRVGCATACDGRGEVGNSYTGLSNFTNPLLDLRGVGGWGSVKRRVVGRTKNNG